MFGTQRRRAFALLVTAAVLAFGGLRHATAQSQSFPPPLSTEALERGLGRYVKPSPESRARIHAAHDRYLNDYRRLESAELEAFSSERPPMMTGGDMGQWMRKYGQLRSRIIALDAGLLAEIAQSVGDDQRLGVERVRWVREGEVLSSGFLSEIGSAFGRGSRVDLGDVLYGASLTDADLLRIDPQLREHQSRYLAMLRKVSEETESLIMELTDRMQREGLWGQALMDAQNDPEAAAKMFERMRVIMSDTFGGIAIANGRVSEVNRRSFRDIRDRVSFEGRLKVYPRWLESAYPSLASQFPQGLVRFARNAQSMPGVEPDAQQTIERLLEEAVGRVISSLDNAEQMADKAAVDAMMMQFSREEGGASRAEMWETMQRTQQEDAESRQKIVASAIEAIKAQVPPEIAAKLGDGNAPEPAEIAAGQPLSAPVSSAEAEAAAAESLEVEETVSNWEIGLPLDTFSTRVRPYSVAELKRFLGAIQARDTKTTLAESLHGDYLAQFNETVEPLRQAHHDARAKMHEVTEGVGRLNMAKADESWDSLNRMVQAMMAVDATFFDGLATAVGDDHADRVKCERLGRVTATLGRATARTWGYAPNSEHPVDVIAIVRDADLSGGDRAIVLAVVAPHAERLAATSKAAFDTSLDSARKLERLQSELFTSNLAGEDGARAAQEYQRRSQQIVVGTKPVLDARAAAQREVLDAALERLSEPSRPTLQRAWNAASYPTLFRDPRSLFSTFKKAESMNDLTDAQRDQLVIALMEYRDSYELASDALLAASATPVPPMEANNAEHWLAVQTRERAIERMRFERDETTARAASKLRLILTAEQLERFRNLTDPATTNTKSKSPW